MQQSSLWKEEAVTLSVAAVALSLLTIVSNCVLIYVVVRTTALHTPTNFFISSLSAGELLTGTFVIPFSGTFATSTGWAFSSTVCKIVGVMSVLGPCVSALSLLVVSVDRCLAVSKPLRYAGLINKTYAMLAVAVVWVSSLLLSLLPLGGSWGRYSYSPVLVTCVMTAVRTHGPEVVVKEVLFEILPVGLVVLIVLKALHHVRGHRRVFVMVPVPVTATSLPPASRSVSSTSWRVKATRTLLLVSLAFLVLRFPAAVVAVACRSSASCGVTARGRRTLLWLSFLSCVVNPLLIMALNRKFRATLKGLLCKSRCGVVRVAPSDKDTFTITSGLHAVLEASLILNVIHGAGPQHRATLRRHVFRSLQSRAVEEPGPVYVGRLGVGALRKTRSSPDCRTAGPSGASS